MKERTVSGWVWDSAHPKDRLLVEIFVAGVRQGVARADEFRTDLAAVGIGDGRYGFTFDLPLDDVAHETIAARVVGTQFFLTRAGEAKSEELLNSTARGLPLLRSAVSKRVCDDSDIAIAAELQQLWRASDGERVARSLGDRRRMWGDIVARRHGALRAALNGSNPQGLAECIVRVQMDSCSEGLMQGARAYQDYVSATEEGKRLAVAPFQDMLASLVQYLAIERAECEEQEFVGAAIVRDQEDLTRAVEAELAPRIRSSAKDWFAPPNIFDGLYGLAIGDRVLHARDIQALYAALRTIEASGVEAPSICEIGGGFGKVAHYAWLLGARQYAIIDLPTVAAMQYFYLRKALPDAAISFADVAAAEKAEGISLLFADGLPEAGRLKADIVLNCDSFPELGDEVCKSYFARIPGWAPLLLSINQEGWRKVRGPAERQTVVGMLLPDFGYVRCYRFRSWVRRGYVEELWRAPARPQP